jgi:DNA sulfur modification protein DndD
VRAHIEGRLPDVAADLTAWLQDAPAPPDREAEVLTRLRQSLVPLETGEEPLHPLSDESARRLLDAIRVVRKEIPRAAAKLSSDLERTTRELGRLQAALEKAPDEHILRPLLEELAAQHAELGESQQELSSVEEEVGALENEAKGLEREQTKEEERLASAGDVEDRVQLVARVQRSVSAFAAALRKRRVEELRETFQRCFSVLARKEDLLNDVRIDPETFAVTFFDEQGRSLPKEDLSAGERQMYAIAILWALALTAKRPLPFLIDTPLARLDSEHRATLVQEYFPHVAHQVVIFSTDTEIDRVYFDELKPHVARMYHLSYDDRTNATHVEDGYFWSGETKSDEQQVESPAA